MFPRICQGDIRDRICHGCVEPGPPRPRSGRRRQDQTDTRSISCRLSVPVALKRQLRNVKDCHIGRCAGDKVQPSSTWTTLFRKPLDINAFPRRMLFFLANMTGYPRIGCRFPHGSLIDPPLDNVDAALNMPAFQCCSLWVCPTFRGEEADFRLRPLNIVDCGVSLLHTPWRFRSRRRSRRWGMPVCCRVPGLLPIRRNCSTAVQGSCRSACRCSPELSFHAQTSMSAGCRCRARTVEDNARVACGKTSVWEAITRMPQSKRSLRKQKCHDRSFQQVALIVRQVVAAAVGFTGGFSFQSSG